MDSIWQEIRTTLIELIGRGVAILPGIGLAVIVLILTWTAANLVRRAMRQVTASTLKSLSLQSLLVQTGFVATWAVGVLLASILAFPDLGLGDLVALLGLGSVAIGFAFQDIFKNFLAGILLLLQEPFSIGDQIIIENYEGTVEEIALRSTQIRTYQGELIVMPNAILFTSPVQVLTGKPQRRTDLAIGVDYNTPLPHAVKTLAAAIKQVEEVMDKPSPEIDIIGFGDSSIDLVVRYWTQPEQKCIRRIKTQVMIALKQACDQENINIPYPIQTLYFYNQEKFDEFSLVQDGTPANSAN